MGKSRAYSVLAAWSLATVLGACAGPGGAPDNQASVEPIKAAQGPISARPRLDPILRFDTDPRQLIGLDGSQVSVLLGRPTLKRRDPPAEIWQYAGRDCVLMLFLYDQPRAGKTQVDHVEVRSKTDQRSTDNCLAGFIKANTASLGDS